MRMSEIAYEGRAPVDAYGPGGFRVAGVWHAGSLALLPARAERWAVAAPAQIAGAEAAFLAAADEIDVLLLGMGPEIAAAPAIARDALEAAGIGVEVMSTPAACRTYNVLLAEGRRVAAGLIAV